MKLLKSFYKRHFWGAAKRKYTVHSISGGAILQVIDLSFSELCMTKLAKIKCAIINMKYANWKYYLCIQKANTYYPFKSFLPCTQGNKMEIQMETS